jgi:hypothetical protein
MSEQSIAQSTIVSFLLDRTRSMDSIKDETIGGFNAYLDALQAEAYLSLQILCTFVLSWPGMDSYQMHLEQLARSILREKGLAAIWQLHLDAAYAYRTGYPVAANAIADLADAVESGKRLRPRNSTGATSRASLDECTTDPRCQLVCRGSGAFLAEGCDYQRERRAAHQLYRDGQRI